MAGIEFIWFYPFVIVKEAVKLSRSYKAVKNGRGTDLIIGKEEYISVGLDGTDITIRGNGKVLAFDNWEDMINAINEEKAVYHKCDYPDGR